MAGILFTPPGDDAADRQVRRDYQDGKLLRIAHGIYARLRLRPEPKENFVRRNWSIIVGKLVPDAVATDRTGMDNPPWRDRSCGAPEGDDVVFVGAPRTCDLISLPGLQIHIRQGVGLGVGAVDGDIPNLGTWLAGSARRLLDNLVPLPTSR